MVDTINKTVETEVEKKETVDNETEVEDNDTEVEDNNTEVEDNESDIELFNIDDYIISEKTLISHHTTKKGESKKSDWIISDVPSIIVKIHDDYILIKHFCKSPDKTHIIKKEDFKFLKKCQIKGEYICGLKWYPEGKIKISEFKARESVQKFVSTVNKLIRTIPNNSIEYKLLDDKFKQLNTPQGAPCDTINEIRKYSNNLDELRKHPTKRIDNMIFNRCSRWTPPISDSYTYEEYKNSYNFTLPIGTRPKDFCWPSELIDTMKEMIRQIICFKNVEPNIKQKIIETIGLNPSECLEIHKCKWSGKEIDIRDYSSKYSSKDNYIEICHRDPQKNFIKTNMYWGFGESNRQQGGYSENDRAKQFSILLNSNPELINTFIAELNPLIKNELKDLL